MPPRGNSFDHAARQRQDARVAEILRMPVHRGPLGSDVTIAEIRRVIRKVKYGKASGLDFISTDLLRIIAEDGESDDVALGVLADLFNQCLTEGRTPTEWTTAVVAALYKKGERTDWANYRLISLLLSVVGKAFGAVLAARLSKFLGEHGRLSPFSVVFVRGDVASTIVLCWQMGREEASIESLLNVVHRRILGAEAKTATMGVRHGSGVVSQKSGAGAAALKFRNNVLSLDEWIVYKPMWYHSLSNKPEDASDHD